MKIPEDAQIAEAKLRQYLLVFREQADKSQYLAQAGFTEDNPDVLDEALRQLIAEVEAEEDTENDYGVFYLVQGDLTGPNGRILSVVTVWMQEKASDQFRFITLKPWR